MSDHPQQGHHFPDTLPCCPVARHCFLGEIPMGAALVDERGLYLNANQRFLDIVGYSLEELQHLTWMRITEPSHVESEYTQMLAMESKKTNSYLVLKQYITKDGRFVWVKLHVIRMINGSTKYLKFAEVVHQESSEFRVGVLQPESVEPEPIEKVARQVVKFTLANFWRVAGVAGAVFVVGFQFASDWRTVRQHDEERTREIQAINKRISSDQVIDRAEMTKIRDMIEQALKDQK